MTNLKWNWPTTSIATSERYVAAKAFENDVHFKSFYEELVSTKLDHLQLSLYDNFEDMNPDDGVLTEYNDKGWGRWVVCIELMSNTHPRFFGSYTQDWFTGGQRWVFNKLNGELSTELEEAPDIQWLLFSPRKKKSDSNFKDSCQVASTPRQARVIGNVDEVDIPRTVMYTPPQDKFVRVLDDDVKNTVTLVKCDECICEKLAKFGQTLSDFSALTKEDWDLVKESITHGENSITVGRFRILQSILQKVLCDVDSANPPRMDMNNILYAPRLQKEAVIRGLTLNGIDQLRYFSTEKLNKVAFNYEGVIDTSFALKNHPTFDKVMNAMMSELECPLVFRATHGNIVNVEHALWDADKAKSLVWIDLSYQRIGVTAGNFATLGRLLGILVTNGGVLNIVKNPIADDCNAVEWFRSILDNDPQMLLHMVWIRQPYLIHHNWVQYWFNIPPHTALIQLIEEMHMKYYALEPKLISQMIIREPI